jgi:hypothetical protein
MGGPCAMSPVKIRPAPFLIQLTKELSMPHNPIISKPAASLIIDGQPTIDFYAALKAVADGKKITKLEWGDERIYGLLRFSVLMIYKPAENPRDSRFYDWIINDGDIAGTDWVIIP